MRQKTPGSLRGLPGVRVRPLGGEKARMQPLQQGVCQRAVKKDKAGSAASRATTIHAAAKVLPPDPLAPHDGAKCEAPMKFAVLLLSAFSLPAVAAAAEWKSCLS